jgi:hypothetical protein
MILNDGALQVTESPKTIRDVRNILAKIRDTHYNAHGIPDYDKIRLSQEYNELIECVRLLQIFDPAHIESDDEKKAFWINVYNLLTVHAIIHFQIKLTVWERPHFFTSSEYNIGGYRFSLFDILHGVLRGNRRRWWFFPLPFRSHDPRIRFTVSLLDPRIHFALHAGSRSCPYIAAYAHDNLQEELDAAARRFINSDRFIYDFNSKVLTCSKIFKWFARDFGANKAERLSYLANFIDDKDIREELREHGSSVSVKFINYDWHLNSSE